jgi:hypothetical protein
LNRLSPDELIVRSSISAGCSGSSPSKAGEVPRLLTMRYPLDMVIDGGERIAEKFFSPQESLE